MSDSELSREQVFHKISTSSVYGNLGFFVGAGFSKAFVIDAEGSPIPFSWGELLKRVSTEMKICSTTLFEEEGKSYPEIASEICQQHSRKNSIEYAHSVTELKNQISLLTNWMPERKIREEIGAMLLEIEPSWIITTNYDFVIECMLLDKGMQLGPGDTFSAPKGQTPIFHLHGHRLDPDSIIATQEDYTQLFRPNQYRQSKLPLQMKESTVVTLGYGLGDANVLMALDWSKNVFTSQHQHLPSDFIQILRKSQPNLVPYRDRNKILVLEVAEIKDFLTELVSYVVQMKIAEKERQLTRDKVSRALSEPTMETINKFIDEPDFREKFIEMIGKTDIMTVSGTVQFLSRCVDQAWERSKASGAFEGYNQQLKIFLDFLCKVPIKSMHPALIDFIANSLDRVGHYVGKDKGQSYAAGATWESCKGKIPADTLSELKSYASQNSKYTLSKLLKK